jgi:class 3 adenylate cyclase
MASLHAQGSMPGRSSFRIAVHAAARILDVSQPGEVLVSGTVRDLLSGSGLRFADRGEFELRGLDGRRSLSALVR